MQPESRLAWRVSSLHRIAALAVDPLHTGPLPAAYLPASIQSCAWCRADSCAAWLAIAKLVLPIVEQLFDLVLAAEHFAAVVLDLDLALSADVIEARLHMVGASPQAGDLDHDLRCTTSNALGFFS